MLKQRLLTAIALIPLVLLAILYVPTSILQWFVLLVTVLAAIEWLTIVDVRTVVAKCVLVILIAILALVFYNAAALLLALAILVWSLAGLLVVRYAHSPLPISIKALFHNKYFGCLNAIVMLTLFLLATIWLHHSETGPILVVYVLISVWLADTGGYFAGKRWGKHKLASVVSPNKTWEGVYGALVLTFIWALIAYWLEFNADIPALLWFGLTLVTVLISVIGDLFESLFKRAHQVKDSGNLLPGHGGILDRVDSLLAAVPVFTAGLYFLGAL
ncbi:MAG: phosphatidate cytidylyltransferase [Gammaproteobacteria bacterium]|nr:phosphatidate cytidylyltransferase [Gammaproteobacteria bacterium]